MGAHHLARGGRCNLGRKVTSGRAHESASVAQPDRPHPASRLSSDCDLSSSGSVNGELDAVSALVVRVVAVEAALERTAALAEAAMVAATEAGRPASPDSPPASPTHAGAAPPSPAFASPHTHASLVCAMPGADEPPSVARRRLPLAPAPGLAAPTFSGSESDPAADSDSLAVLAPHSPLHWEVRRFVDANDELVRRQAQLRQYALDMLAHDVRSAWPCAQLRVYGSLATGLCSPSSDIDVALVNAPPASAPQLLLALHALLQGRPHVAHAQLLPHAQVPILKLKILVPAADGHLALVDFDVSVCAGVSMDESHQGLASVAPVRAALRELPALRPLTIVLKHYLAGAPYAYSRA
ncbi:hypothetical protein T492DRAFT_83796 [Pavlovales sp. CCMP2436]|nr:hypothetical protein T492DRAFT_83796 [Pavlovales sp. CCMP2436]